MLLQVVSFISSMQRENMFLATNSLYVPYIYDLIRSVFLQPNLKMSILLRIYVLLIAVLMDMKITLWNNLTIIIYR